MQPLIAITTYGRVERPTPSDHYDEYYSVPVAYVTAVRRSGGIPVLLPPGEMNDAVVERFDGVVVAGGVDVDPARYGMDRSSEVQQPDLARDDAELRISAAIIVHDLPALFVCRGMQLLNVSLGGTLHQHIPTLGIGDIHRDSIGFWTEHAVAALAGSRVAEAMGTTEVETYSGHHQAVDVVAEGLEVTATAPDGLPEAVEVRDARWIVGVQWHPEVTARDDPTQQGLFNQLARVAIGG